MTPEEKDIIIKDLQRLMQSVEILYTGESRSHAEGALMDRIIEIREGEWDEDS